MEPLGGINLDVDDNAFTFGRSLSYPASHSGTTIFLLFPFHSDLAQPNSYPHSHIINSYCVMDNAGWHASRRAARQDVSVLASPFAPAQLFVRTRLAG